MNVTDYKAHFLRKRSLLPLFVAILLYGLYGCSLNSGKKFAFSDAEPITLWIVTEETSSDGMNYQARLLADRFQQEHANVTIRIDILPTEENDRSTRLEELFAQINAGYGPDIFLLPTATVAELDYPTRYTYRRISPLFPDVAVSMREDLFADIEEYYSGDSSLKKDSLNTEIMEAGKVGNARYILPIRFNQPVIYIFDEILAPYNVSVNLADLTTIDQWMDFAIAQGDPMLACGAEYTSHNAFSSLVDYDNKIVTLSANEVEVYMRKFQQLEALIGTSYQHRSSATLWPMSKEWYKYPVHLDSLSNALIYCAIAQEQGNHLSMYPLRSTDGDIIANISYYGAISSNCKNTNAAYAFLRLFLTEEFQWETSRPSTQYARLLENSWPVRTHGSVVPLWDSIQRSGRNYANLELSDSSIKALWDSHIDIVRFPFHDNFSAILFSLNSVEGKPADDLYIRKMSEEYILSLKDKFA